MNEVPFFRIITGIWFLISTILLVYYSTHKPPATTYEKCDAKYYHIDSKTNFIDYMEYCLKNNK